MTLLEQQQLFTQLTAKLIEWAYENGYTLTYSQTFRTIDQAKQNAAEGCGIKNSLHCVRLAVDFNLFKAGAYLTSVSDYKPLADYWCALHPLCRAGANFAMPDADHFSMTYQGIS